MQITHRTVVYAVALGMLLLGGCSATSPLYTPVTKGPISSVTLRVDSLGESHVHQPVQFWYALAACNNAHTGIVTLSKDNNSETVKVRAASPLLVTSAYFRAKGGKSIRGDVETMFTPRAGAHYAVTTHIGKHAMRVKVGVYDKDSSVRPIKAVYGKQADTQDKRLCAATNKK